MVNHAQPQHHACESGFTLIELLVAVSILAVMAITAWGALDGMQKASTQARAHTDAVLTLDAGLAQWVNDLDALQELAHTVPMDWNGRALRITRRNNANPNEGVLVVAWTRGERGGVDQWLRWQSAPVRSREAWQMAWGNAAQWAESQTTAQREHEVAIVPLEQWQIYYFRGGAWSNALSSAGTAAMAAPANAPPVDVSVPDGVRLALTLPGTHPLAGVLTRDWARSTNTGSAQ